MKKVICTSEKQTLILTVVFVLVTILFTYNSMAETALEKSILEFKNALQGFGKITQNKNSNISDVFQEEIPVKEESPEFLWKNKEDFFNAVSRGEMINYKYQTNSSEPRLFAESIAYLLSSSYQTSLKVAGTNRACLGTFESHLSHLIHTINLSKLTKVGNKPPDFISSDEERVRSYNYEGREFFGVLSNACSVNFAGYNSPYPFIDSLSLLLKEYSNLTESYVTEMRLKKIEDYKISQEKSRIAQQEEIVLQKEEDDKNNREKKFREEFIRKEDLKMSQCLASQQYARYTAAKSIEEDLARIKSSREIIKREKEISSKSGYEDGNKLYEQGQIIVYSEESIKKLKVNYRKNGGTESNVNKINAGKNPCKFN